MQDRHAQQEGPFAGGRPPLERRTSSWVYWAAVDSFTEQELDAFMEEQDVPVPTEDVPRGNARRRTSQGTWRPRREGLPGNPPTPTPSPPPSQEAVDVDMLEFDEEVPSSLPSSSCGQPYFPPSQCYDSDVEFWGGVSSSGRAASVISLSQ